MNTNVSAIKTQLYLNKAQIRIDQSKGALASGKWINRASDDAAGMAIASRMTSQLRQADMAVRNANDGSSLVQTAEGALGSVKDMLQRMRELAVQASSGTLSDTERAYLNQESKQLQAEIDRVSKATTFNGKRVLDGSFNQNIKLGTESSENVKVTIGDTSAEGILGARKQIFSATGGFSSHLLQLIKMVPLLLREMQQSEVIRQVFKIR